MDARVKRLSEISNKISMISFAEHLSQQDYAEMRKLREEFKEVDKSLAGYKGWLCRVYPNYAPESPFYFTGDSTLCCSSEPTYFESEDEVRALYAESDLAAKAGYTMEVFEAVHA